jgi:hypothetical protein
MTYLSRNLIRQMILAEARKKKAPLLDPGFDFGETEDLDDLTDLDLSRVEATEVVDIDKETKIEKVPLSLGEFYDDEDEMAFDDKTEQGFGVFGIDDFEESEEESESETVEDLNPDYNQYVRHGKYQEPRLAGMTSRHDPAGRTHGQIQQDVFATHDELYKPPTKKTEAQKEADFLKKMEDMIAQGRPATDFPEDPEFGPEHTIELPKDRFRIKPGDEDTKDLDETINRLIRESIRRKLKSRSKFNRRRI